MLLGHQRVRVNKENESSLLEPESTNCPKLPDLSMFADVLTDALGRRGHNALVRSQSRQKSRPWQD